MPMQRVELARLLLRTAMMIKIIWLLLIALADLIKSKVSQSLQ